MKKIGIFFGTTSGTTEDIANRIAERLGVATADVHNVADADAVAVAPYEVLLLGSSTWGVGDLQDDWESFLPQLKRQDLSGKAVAVFGTGDSASFGDSFCDAIGTIYTELKGTGCRFCGFVSADGYTFDGSTALIDGGFVGLPIDELNEDDLTDSRLDSWIAQLRKECF